MEGIQDTLSALTVSNSKIIYRDSDPVHSFCLNGVS
jgi:hypothetical protein